MMISIVLYCRAQHSRRLCRLSSLPECLRSNSKIFIYIESLILHCDSGNNSQFSHYNGSDCIEKKIEYSSHHT